MNRSYFMLIGMTLFMCFSELKSQGFYFGPKGGLTIANQNWNGYQRNPLFTYHGDLFIESLDPNQRGSLYAQIGYHNRGSSIRLNTLTGGIFNEGYIFKNLSLGVGAKRKLPFSDTRSAYYFFGLRLEYTIDTNLDEYQERYSSPFFPIDFFVNKLNYGVSVGGGYEFPVSDFIIPFVELNIAPDLSIQYDGQQINNVLNPFNGTTTTIPANQVRNIIFEITLGLKFLREVIVE